MPDTRGNSHPEEKIIDNISQLTLYALFVAQAVGYIALVNIA